MVRTSTAMWGTRVARGVIYRRTRWQHAPHPLGIERESYYEVLNLARSLK